MEAVSNVQRTVSTKSSIPALEGILLRAAGTQLTLCGYDLELGMTTSIEASCTEEGAVVLSARLFGDIVRRLPGDTVQIAVDDKNITSIESGASEFSIVGIPADEYPDLPSISDQSSVTLSQPLLKSMIRQTIFAVAESDAKPIHTGTLFEIGGGKIRLISVDGYRLAIREENAVCEEELSFVVPGKTLGEVSKLLHEDDSMLELRVGRRHIQFLIGDYCVTSRLLEGEFLDYRAALPKDKKTEVTVSTRTLIDSVERVSLLITDRLKSPVRCVFNEDTVKLLCSTTMGRANDQIEAKITGDPLEIGFNNKYLLDALRAAECDEVRLELGGPISPMLVLPKEGDSFSFLVLPVRLRSEV